MNIDNSFKDDAYDSTNNTNDTNDTNNANELEYILKEIEDCSSDYEFNADSLLAARLIEYDTNYNVKQLLLICEYYGLLKEVKLNKLKKQELIFFLLDFEENVENSLIVYKRKQLWYFMNELKNDKFMKKYILWQM